jgi:hypothetical protein
MSCGSSGHINKTLAIYFGLSMSMVGMLHLVNKWVDVRHWWLILLTKIRLFLNLVKHTKNIKFYTFETCAFCLVSAVVE